MRNMTKGEMSEHVTVNGFTVLPVKFCKKSAASHHLFVKDHKVRETDPEKPKDRTLFVLNVPPYATEASLENIFSVCGKIQNVVLQKSPTSGRSIEESSFFRTSVAITGFKVAYIVYKNSSAVQKALKLPFDGERVLSTEEKPILTGVRKWCEEYRQDSVNVKKLQSEINQYMQEYDKKVQEEQQREKELEGVPDEDGWVTVTRQGKTKPAALTEAQQQRITARDRKKRKEKELLNFYAFQMRESKREHIAALRKKFEEDKQKIALMKASRKFRPY